jgi:hypothetical protein
VLGQGLTRRLVYQLPRHAPACGTPAGPHNPQEGRPQPVAGGAADGPGRTGSPGSGPPAGAGRVGSPLPS